MAGGKQLAGLHADAFERLAVARTAGVAAVGGWSHTAMLPECRRNARTSLDGRVAGTCGTSSAPGEVTFSDAWSAWLCWWLSTSVRTWKQRASSLRATATMA